MVPSGSRAPDSDLSSEAEVHGSVGTLKQVERPEAAHREVPSRWVESRPPRRWLPQLDLGELWAYRELALFLALRDLKLRYRQTFFGIAWAVLQPLAGVAVFSLVFGHFVRVATHGVPYPVFVFAGLAIWTYFSTGLDFASKTLVEGAELIRKVYFPRLLAPLASVLPGLVDLVCSIVILAVFIGAYGVTVGTSLLLVPVWVAAAVLITAGVGLWLSALNVQYRDVRYALTFLIQLWFFASPVVYPSSAFAGGWRYALAVNPMTGVIDGFRWSVGAGPAPPTSDLISFAIGAVVLITGVAYFQTVERRFADLV